MAKRFQRRAIILTVVILSAGTLTGGYFAITSFQSRRRAEDRRSIWNAVSLLKAAWPNEKGEYWIGDVAGLYPLFGPTFREVAEADTAPIRPLVDHPKPFHGYFVRAMESAPSPTFDGPETVSLKGHSTFKGTSAFCIYPAEKGNPDLWVWIVFPGGIYRKKSDGTEPVISWPKGGTRPIGWGMID